MHRPIKFRAWDIRNKKMVTDALVLAETHQLITVNAEYFNSPFSFFDGCKWMQFTGYYGWDGIEIYEGDYIKCSKNGAIAEIKFVDGHFIFHTIEGTWLDEWNWADDTHNFKVVGHIYDSKF